MNPRANRRIQKKQQRKLSPGQIRRLRARIRDLNTTIDRQYGIVRIAKTHGMQSRTYHAAHTKLRALQHHVVDRMVRHLNSAVALTHPRDVANAIWRAGMFLKQHHQKHEYRPSPSPGLGLHMTHNNPT